MIDEPTIKQLVEVIAAVSRRVWRACAPGEWRMALGPAEGQGSRLAAIGTYSFCPAVRVQPCWTGPRALLLLRGLMAVRLGRDNLLKARSFLAGDSGVRVEAIHWQAAPAWRALRGGGSDPLLLAAQLAPPKEASADEDHEGGKERLQSAKIFGDVVWIRCPTESCPAFRRSCIFLREGLAWRREAMIKCGSCQARTALAEFRCAMCDALIMECPVDGEHGGDGSDQQTTDERAEFALQG